MKILAVIGTRPEAIKMAPVIKALRQRPWADLFVLLTGQHDHLVHSALGDFDIAADEDLRLMRPGQSLAGLTGRAFLGIEQVLLAQKPDLVLAQGDTTTVMATAICCFYAGIPFGHVEAGLRTGDLQSPFPEEFNRIIAGRTADLHFAPTESSVRALELEGVESGWIVLTGNTVIDALADAASRVDPSKFAPRAGRRLILLTNHRRENFGEPMRGVLTAVRDVAQGRDDVDVLFPVHPNPIVRRVTEEVFAESSSVRRVEPLSYLDFVAAMKAAHIIVTDSGGVQEEAPFLGKPTLVTRNETERPDAVIHGVARLVGTNYEAVVGALGELLDQPQSYAFMARGVSPYGDGMAAQRIAQAIDHRFGITGAGAPQAFSILSSGG